MPYSRGIRSAIDHGVYHEKLEGDFNSHPVFVERRNLLLKVQILIFQTSGWAKLPRYAT